MPRRRSRTRSRRSPRRSPRRSLRRSPHRRSPRRRTGRRFRATVGESVQLKLQDSSESITGNVIDIVPGQTMTITFADLPDSLNDNDTVTISRREWIVASVHPSTNAVVFRQRPVDVADLITGLQTARVSEGPPALLSQTAGASELPSVVPLQRDPEQLYNREDDVEFEELDASIVPGENREVLTSHTFTTGSARQTHTHSSNYVEHPTTPTMQRSASSEEQARIPVQRRRYTQLRDSPYDVSRDRSRSPRSIGRDTRTHLTRETP